MEFCATFQRYATLDHRWPSAESLMWDSCSRLLLITWTCSHLWGKQGEGGGPANYVVVTAKWAAFCCTATRDSSKWCYTLLPPSGHWMLLCNALALLLLSTYRSCCWSDALLLMPGPSPATSSALLRCAWSLQTLCLHIWMCHAGGAGLPVPLVTRAVAKRRTREKSISRDEEERWWIHWVILPNRTD